MIARIHRASVAALAATVVVAFVPAIASAEVLSCEFDPQTRVLSIEFEGTAVIERQAGSPNIRVGGVVCAAPDLSATANVQTVDTIAVEGSIGDDFLIVSLANGPFAPGATAETAPQGPPSEIEFSVGLRQGVDFLEIVGTGGPDRITFGAGSSATNQRAIATNQDNDPEIFVGGEQGLIASGGAGADRLQGLEGHGTGSAIRTPLNLVGDDGDDTIFGGLGDDGLTGGFGRDTLHGSSGNDGVTGSDDTDTVTGGPGNDVLENFASSENSFPGPGRDTMAPGPGNDEVIGHPDAEETVSYASSASAVTVNLGRGTATGEGTDSLSSIDGAIGSNFGDTLEGNADENVLTGGRGDDILRAGEEDDGLAPGRGSDFVRGGAGRDRVAYFDSPVGVTLSLRTGTATDDGSDRLELIEDVFGSPFDDILDGNDGTNQIEGRAGEDDLSGRGGDDGLIGDEDDDDFDGGEGTDFCGQGDGTGTLVRCENVGTFELKPRRARVSAGEQLDYLLTWTHPRRWRRLDTVELRVRDGARVLAWVRWNQESNTFQLFDPGDDRFVSGPARGPGTLRSPFAVLHLRRSDQVVFDTKTIGVLMRITFRPAAEGGHIVEATAEDDRNNRMAWERAGALKIAARD